MSWKSTICSLMTLTMSTPLADMLAGVGTGVGVGITAGVVSARQVLSCGLRIVWWPFQSGRRKVDLI